MKFVFLFILLVENVFSAPTQSGCTIKVSKDVKLPDPLILKPNFNEDDAFIYSDSNGNINLELSDQILLVCAGSGNVFETSGLENQQYEIVTCTNNNTFSTNSTRKFNFSEFKCKQYPESSAIRSGKVCNEDKTDVIIGFEVLNSFVTLLNVCFDEKLMTTVYSFANMSKAVQLGVTGVSRPDFRTGDGFFSVPINSLYNRQKQEDTFAFLLGSQELAKYYIHDSDDNFFLARGHFSAMRDYVYGSQQRGTFYYINAAPQWQVFNDGNWLVIEESCQNYATNRQKNLQVYTGGFGVSTLKDINGNEEQLYLYAEENADNSVPVPRFYWKVVYYPVDRAGVAFIGLNNPYEFDEENDVFCQDICNEISWVDWKNRKNLTEGYSYCCDVNEFRKTVTALPQFDVEKLLV